MRERNHASPVRHCSGELTRSTPTTTMQNLGRKIPLPRKRGRVRVGALTGLAPAERVLQDLPRKAEQLVHEGWSLDHWTRSPFAPRDDGSRADAVGGASP